MSRSIEARLNRLAEARQERDAASVREVITVVLGGLTPDQLWECREPDVCRPRLADFLATQPARTLAIIERWSRNRKATK